MNIETKKLADLKCAPYNPRTITGEALKGLKASIDRFGLVEPIIWNRRSGFIVGGHQRFKVLQASGVEETQVVVVDLDPGDEKTLNVTLNNPLIAGVFSETAGELLSEIVESHPEFSSETEIQQLLNKISSETTTPPDEPERDPGSGKVEKQVCRPGQLWHLSHQRLTVGEPPAEADFIIQAWQDKTGNKAIRDDGVIYDEIE